MESDRKNIVVIGAGYGGITAALRLSNLFRSVPDFRLVLIDRYPFHTLKTQLHEAAQAPSAMRFLPVHELYHPSAPLPM